MKNITKGQNETKTNKQMNIKNMKGNYQHQPNKNQRKKNEQNLAGRRFARQRSQTRENRLVKFEALVQIRANRVFSPIRSLT